MSLPCATTRSNASSTFDDFEQTASIPRKSDSIDILFNNKNDSEYQRLRFRLIQHVAVSKSQLAAVKMQSLFRMHIVHKRYARFIKTFHILKIRTTFPYFAVFALESRVTNINRPELYSKLSIWLLDHPKVRKGYTISSFEAFTNTDLFIIPPYISEKVLSNFVRKFYVHQLRFFLEEWHICSKKEKLKRKPFQLDKFAQRQFGVEFNAFHIWFRFTQFRKKRKPHFSGEFLPWKHFLDVHDTKVARKTRADQHHTHQIIHKALQALANMMFKKRQEDQEIKAADEFWLKKNMHFAYHAWIYYIATHNNKLSMEKQVLKNWYSLVIRKNHLKKLYSVFQERANIYRKRSGLNAFIKNMNIERLFNIYSYAKFQIRHPLGLWFIFSLKNKTYSAALALSFYAWLQFFRRRKMWHRFVFMDLKTSHYDPLISRALTILISQNISKENYEMDSTRSTGRSNDVNSAHVPSSVRKMIKEKGQVLNSSIISSGLMFKVLFSNSYLSKERPTLLYSGDDEVLLYSSYSKTQSLKIYQTIMQQNELPCKVFILTPDKSVKEKLDQLDEKSNIKDTNKHNRMLTNSGQRNLFLQTWCSINDKGSMFTRIAILNKLKKESEQSVQTFQESFLNHFKNVIRFLLNLNIGSAAKTKKVRELMTKNFPKAMANRKRCVHRDQMLIDAYESHDHAENLHNTSPKFTVNETFTLFSKITEANDIIAQSFEPEDRIDEMSFDGPNERSFADITGCKSELPPFSVHLSEFQKEYKLLLSKADTTGLNSFQFNRHNEEMNQIKFNPTTFSHNEPYTQYESFVMKHRDPNLKTVISRMRANFPKIGRRGRDLRRDIRRKDENGHFVINFYGEEEQKKEEEIPEISSEYSSLSKEETNIQKEIKNPQDNSYESPTHDQPVLTKLEIQDQFNKNQEENIQLDNYSNASFVQFEDEDKLIKAYEMQLVGISESESEEFQGFKDISVSDKVMKELPSPRAKEKYKAFLHILFDKAIRDPKDSTEIQNLRRRLLNEYAHRRSGFPGIETKNDILPISGVLDSFRKDKEELLHPRRRKHSKQNMSSKSNVNRKSRLFQNGENTMSNSQAPSYEYKSYSQSYGHFNDKDKDDDFQDEKKIYRKTNSDNVQSEDSESYENEYYSDDSDLDIGDEFEDINKQTNEKSDENEEETEADKLSAVDNTHDENDKSISKSEKRLQKSLDKHHTPYTSGVLTDDLLQDVDKVVFSYLSSYIQDESSISDLVVLDDNPEEHQKLLDFSKHEKPKPHLWRAPPPPKQPLRHSLEANHKKVFKEKKPHSPIIIPASSNVSSAILNEVFDDKRHLNKIIFDSRGTYIEPKQYEPHKEIKEIKKEHPKIEKARTNKSDSELPYWYTDTRAPEPYRGEIVPQGKSARMLLPDYSSNSGFDIQQCEIVKNPIHHEKRKFMSMKNASKQPIVDVPQKSSIFKNSNTSSKSSSSTNGVACELAEVASFDATSSQGIVKQYIEMIASAQDDPEAFERLRRRVRMLRKKPAFVGLGIKDENKSLFYSKMQSSYVMYSRKKDTTRAADQFYQILQDHLEFAAMAKQELESAAKKQESNPDYIRIKKQMNDTKFSVDPKMNVEFADLTWLNNIHGITIMQFNEDDGFNAILAPYHGSQRASRQIGHFHERTKKNQKRSPVKVDKSSNEWNKKLAQFALEDLMSVTPFIIPEEFVDQFLDKYGKSPTRHI